MTATAPAETPEHARERDLVDAIAANLARLRRNSGLDVERLAALSGLTPEHLLALESGRAAPRLRALWALADAFEVPFSVMIAGAPCAMESFHVLRATESPVVDSGGSGFRTRPLSLAGDPREPEVYEVVMAPGWLEEAAPHAIDTFEHIVVIQGTLMLRAGESSAVLEPGDAVFFCADRPHAYQNPGRCPTLLHLTMTYAGDWGEALTDD